MDNDWYGLCIKKRERSDKASMFEIRCGVGKIMKNILCKLALIATMICSSANASAALIVTLDIDGNTAFNPFTLISSASNTANITSFTFDLSTLGLVFDPETGGTFANGNGVAFTPRSNSDSITGLVAPYDVTDGATIFTQFFTDFNPGESFIWDIDVDFLSGVNRVDGDDLIGALLSISFDDGTIIDGIFEGIPGNADASGFVAVSFSNVNAVSEPAPIALLVLSLALMSLRGRRI